MSNVRFKKGTPKEMEDGKSDKDPTYTYQDGERTEIWVKFRDGRVRAVTVLSKDDFSREIQGIYFGNTAERILEKFGQPDETRESKDRLSRVYAFPKHQVFFALSQNKVEAMGIYNPAQGLPIRFKEEDQKPATDKK